MDSIEELTSGSEHAEKIGSVVLVDVTTNIANSPRDQSGRRIGAGVLTKVIDRYDSGGVLVHTRIVVAGESIELDWDNDPAASATIELVSTNTD